MSNPHGPAESKYRCQAFKISTHPPSSHCSFSLHSSSQASSLHLLRHSGGPLFYSLFYFHLPVKQITLTVHLITLHASTDHIHSFDTSYTTLCSSATYCSPPNTYISSRCVSLNLPALRRSLLLSMPTHRLPPQTTQEEIAQPSQPMLSRAVHSTMDNWRLEQKLAKLCRSHRQTISSTTAPARH